MNRTIGHFLQGLKDCPFCHKNDALLISPDYSEEKPRKIYAYHVHCHHCGCNGRNMYAIGWCETPEAAIEAWQDRGPIENGEEDQIDFELPGAIGGTPVVPVASAGLGIDWNDGKYILRTETSLTMNERKMALIFKMMSNARRLAKKSLEKYTNAQLYAEMVGTGENTAHVKCNEFGVDPDKKEG